MLRHGAGLHGMRADVQRSHAALRDVPGHRADLRELRQDVHRHRDPLQAVPGYGADLRGLRQDVHRRPASLPAVPGYGANLRGLRADVHRAHAPLPAVPGYGAGLHRNAGGRSKGARPAAGACRWESTPPEVRQAQSASQGNARRARKLAAEVVGPVPPEVYEAIRASGPCVYCGQPATTVDHVRPLARGGWEHEANLVPACGSCNYSKCARLLTEWRPDRVAHAVACSPVVAANGLG